jgi:hypothetical protein
MVSALFFYQLVLVALVWLCVMLHWAWPSDPATVCPTTPEPLGPRPKRHHEPKPFAGLTTKPPCDACAHASGPRPQAPCAAPPRMVMTRGRPRQLDTSTHFCPNADCAYRGWVGWGNLRANGHPNRTSRTHLHKPMKPPRSKLRGITRKGIVCETPRFLTLFPLQGNLGASSEESPD